MCRDAWRHADPGDRLLEDLPLISCVFPAAFLSCVFVPSIVEMGRTFAYLDHLGTQNSLIIKPLGRLLAGPSKAPL